MSIKRMSMVWENSDETGAGLLIMLALADFANDDGLCWPSIDTLAKKARVSRRTVQDNIRRLEKSGEVSVGLNEGPSGVNLYRVLPHMGGAKSAPRKSSAPVQSASKGGRNLQQGGAQSSGAHLHPNHQEPSIVQPSEEPSSTTRVMMADLLHLGISENKAKDLLGRYPVDRISEALLIVSDKVSTNGVRNPAGYLLKVLDND